MKLNKSGLSILTLALITSNLIVAEAQPLSDINNHWAKSTIEKFVNQGYISGYNDETFKPNQNMTRAEFVKTFNKIFGITNKSNKVFEDTKNHWAKNEIDIAVTNGVCNGISEIKFNPNGQITREETAVMLSNYKKISDSNLNKIGVFNDKGDISNWAKNSVEGVLEKGYMGGYTDGNFKPKKPITRAEAVITLDRVVNQNITTPQPEPSDGMKLPTINFAKEQNVAVTGRGGARGYASATSAKGNVIQGTIYAKYGDPTRGMHTYGSVNQKEYDMVLQFVKDNLKTINFRLQSDWVYTQLYLDSLNKGTTIDDYYVDPILQANNINVPFKSWKMNNKYLMAGVQKGLLNREDAERLAMYNSAVSHVKSKIPEAKDVDDATIFSAYETIFKQLEDCDSSAQCSLIIADILGLNASIAGVSEGHVNIMVLSNGYWFVDGSIPTIKKTDNVFYKHNTVLEAPTYNLGY
ncbi:MAG: S-layer homology domain-containing protein [Clostridium sp.]